MLGWHPFSKSLDLLKVLEGHNYWLPKILGAARAPVPPCSYSPVLSNKYFILEVKLRKQSFLSKNSLTFHEKMSL